MHFEFGPTHVKPSASQTFLPTQLIEAHDFCLLNHDVLVELLRSGEKHGAFLENIEFRDERDRQEYEASTDLFDWFERTARLEDRNRFLRRLIFPALLSDFLHFIYEALETSRKAKLIVSYALIRKPIQENLFVLEVIATGLDAFANSLAETPASLDPRRGRSLDSHVQRIGAALHVLGEEDRFDATYLAQLRYDKTVEDTFDGICNKAVHLFTSSSAIRTEPLNVNFIFSGREAKLTQWYYLYSRLPYILFYARRLVEHVCATLVQTVPNYLADIERRVAASALLWARNIDEAYRHPAIDRFVAETRARLVAECKSAGHREPTLHDLVQMRDSGTLPDD